MADFGPDKVFCPNFQLAISQEPPGFRSWNLQSSHDFNDTYKWCKNEEILRGKGVMPWMIWYGIALDVCMYMWTVDDGLQHSNNNWVEDSPLH